MVELTEAQLYNLSPSGTSTAAIKHMMVSMMVKHLYEVHNMGIREIHQKVDLPIKEIKRILNLTK